jgi:hypothetical protein
MKRIVQFMVYSNLLVSVAAAILTSGLLFCHAAPHWILYGLISFFGVFSVYNFQRIYKAQKGGSTIWLSWVDNHKSVLISLTLVSALCLCLIMLSIEIHSVTCFFLLGFVAFVSIFYVVPISTKSLREFPFVKSLLISIVWVIATVIFPFTNNQLPLVQNFWEIMAFFVYFYALTIPSDLRDMTTDSSGLKTLPQLIGPKQSKYVVLLLLITFSWMQNIHFETWLFCLPVTIQLFLVLRIKHKSSNTYFALIDACISGVGVLYFFL